MSQASSGVRVAGSGSTAEVIANQRIVTEMQVNQIMANAINQSFGYQRGKVDAKGRALAFRSAAHLTAVNKSAPKMMSGFMQMKGIPAGK